MCGIAGFLNYPEGDIAVAQKLLSHRGPDSQTSFSHLGLNLVHTRLSVQDISQGAQPFKIGNWVIIFNGEIYNHLQLRSKVNGYSFCTKSDTETLLALYIQFGVDSLQMCDGMFAFAILDIRSSTLILGRDRSGKKPLYIYKNKSSIVFASELNALRQCVKNLTVDDMEIYSFIRNGFFYGEKTPFQKTTEVLPGCILKISIKDLNVTQYRYFDASQWYKKNKIKNIDSALQALDECLNKSVKDRLISSDLEVGAFLSGGIDSSLIAAIASKYTDKLKTFTVKFDGVYDESSLAQLTASKYGTDHREINISMNLRDEVEKILIGYGEPFMDSSAIPSYYVSKAAKEHVSVVLNGDGADELFGGYRRYVPIANNWIKFVSFFPKIENLLPQPVRKQTIYYFLHRLIRISRKQGIDFYNSATNDLFEDLYDFKKTDTFERMNQSIEEIDRQNISNLSKLLLKDFNFILPNDLLKKMDIATMAHSLEGRSPFLSKYMLEFAPTLDDSLKIKGTTTKVILRELGKKYLPDIILNQPKRGFEVPLTNWVNRDLRENILDSLGVNCFSRNFLPDPFIKALIDKKLNISEDRRAKILWTLYSLEVWHKNLEVDNTHTQESGC